MKIQFCGAAQAVTGSTHLITLNNGYQIVLDCGLYQGRDKEMDKFNATWLYKPGQIDAMILSHAHIDHCGRIPKLVKDGFSGEIHCTHATRSLCNILLLDSAKIQERDAEWHNKKLLKKKKKKKKDVKAKLKTPLYVEQDVLNAMPGFVGHEYERWFKISPDVQVLFRDTGHILGSASITLKIQEDGKEIMVGFTGDIGRPDRPIIKDPVPMPEVDYLICESTYGDKDHESKPEQTNKLKEVIQRTLDKGGKLIIPAFSVGRTQEIVYMMDKMETAGELPKVGIFVDSPLGVNATKIYGAHPECYDATMRDYLLMDDNPFGFNDLKYIASVEESKALNATQEPCVVISSSGMMNAGRVRHHLFNSIEHEKNTFLMVGYCSPDTAGGMLKNGIESIKVFGEWKMVKAEIESMDSFSAHADRGEMYQFIENQKPRLKKLFLVHGEIDRQESFKAYLNERGIENVEIPDLADAYDLD